MLNRIVRIGALGSLCLVTALASAQAPTGGRPARPQRAPLLRPGLFFEENWKPSRKAEQPVSSQSSDNPDLDVDTFVPAGQLLLAGTVNSKNNPKLAGEAVLHVWTGLCTSPCALALRDKRHFADLSGLARISLETTMSGFHHVRPIVKLADGTWWVGDQAIGTTSLSWLSSQIAYASLHWLKLDMKRLVTVGNLVDKIDLSRVDEIGFVDLKPSSGHGYGGFASVARIRVYARAVPRTGQD
ncbi:MAG: hypothetical protein ACREU2_05170 [Steroidobacteraceae bacterium]